MPAGKIIPIFNKRIIRQCKGKIFWGCCLDWRGTCSAICIKGNCISGFCGYRYCCGYIIIIGCISGDKRHCNVLGCIIVCRRRSLPGALYQTVDTIDCYAGKHRDGVFGLHIGDILRSADNNGCRFFYFVCT